MSHAFAKTNGLHTLVDTLDVFNREGYLYPLPTEIGKEIELALSKDGHEKALIGWLWPLNALGRTPSGKKSTLLAPAVLYEASLIVDEGIYYAEINLKLPQANPAFTDWMSENAEINLSELSSQICPQKWNDIAIENFSRAVNSTKELQVDLSDHHEELDSTFNQNLSESPRILPLGGFSILPKSKGSQGVLYELKVLSQTSNTSEPIRELIQGHPQKLNKLGQHNNPIQVKASLSDNQKRIVYSSDDNTLTRVVGPPGTGKSFTTAAIASHAYARGQKVLVVSRNVEAVEVVADKIENELEMKNLVVRAARSTSRTQLRNRLKRILNMIGIKNMQTKDVRLTNSLLIRQLTEIRNIENSINSYLKSIALRSKRLFSAKGKWYEALLAKAYSSILSQKSDINTLTSTLLEEEAKFQGIVRDFQHEQYNVRLSKLLNNDISSLNAYYSGLKNREGAARKLNFAKADFNVILDAFPVWTVTTADLNRVLPLQSEIFDLIIIDEASQTDIASSIPALYRAKRAVIIGDPYQLRHISFVSTTQQETLKKRFLLEEKGDGALAYNKTSILDLAQIRTQSADQVHMLDEHYRSQPEIIQFSNSTYYDDNLKIMTRGFSLPQFPPLKAIPIEGHQDDRGVNKLECELLLKKTRQLINSMRLNGALKSIGILSPFSAQSKYLKKEIEKSLNLDDLHDFNIFVGTPFHFQGNERDIMLISLAVSDKSHSAAFRYLEQPGVFNVAITRARNSQFIFHSFDPDGKYQKNLAASYVRDIGKPSKTVSFADISMSSIFWQDLLSRLADVPNLLVEQDVIIAGQRLDVLLTFRGKKTAIDLIGLVGPRGEALPIHAVRSLQRIGISVIYLDAFTGAENCMNSLIEELLIAS